jgi:hypothetical protein
MGEVQKRGHKIDALVGFPGFSEEGIKKRHGIIENRLFLYGDKNGFVMVHAAPGEGSEPGKNGDVVADELNEIGAFQDRGAGDADIEPAGDQIIEKIFVVNHDHQQIHAGILFGWGSHQ